MYEYIVAIVLILLLIITFTLLNARNTAAERMCQQPILSRDAVDSQPYIKLYEGYNFTNLAYNFAPEHIDYTVTDIIRGYLRQILRCDLKSVDINLPKVGGEYDQIRRVEIWAVDQIDNNTASVEAGFYNSYLMPESELRANPGKFKQLIRVLPGNHVKLEITEPVKKIFLIAIV